MEFLLDAFVEFFIELLCDPFLSLSSAFVPQKKLTEKTKRMIGYVLLIVSFFLFFGLIIGIFILFKSNGKSFWGWLLISLYVVFLLTGMILKKVSHHKE